MKRISKVSSGIICWKYDKQYKVLIERKRCTYAFVEFVRGHYDPNNDRRLKYLLNNMTVNEKIDILSLDFGILWQRIWLYNPDQIYVVCKTYKKKANKFYTTFVADGGVRLRNLLNGTSNVESTWEFPKGRKKSNSELDIDCAIREFGEETGIKKSSYKILFDIDPIVHSHADQYVNYISIYYSALVKPGTVCNPKISFECKDQLSEVDALRWATINEIDSIDPSGRLGKQARKSLKLLKQKYKK